MAKKDNFSGMTIDELRQKEQELRKEGFALRLQQTTGQLTDSSALRRNRRDLARVLTFQNQKTSSEGTEKQA